MSSRGRSETAERFRLAERRSQNLRQLLLRAHRELNAAVASELVRRGHVDIRPIHSRLLENLDRDGNSITVVAKRAHMTKQAMGSLARELEVKGYLRRVVDKDDRRARVLSFTAKGWRLMLETFEIVSEIEAQMSLRLGTEPFEVLRAGLVALTDERTPKAESGQTRVGEVRRPDLTSGIKKRTPSKARQLGSSNR